jgi:signal transduction histidine kinase
MPRLPSSVRLLLFALLVPGASVAEAEELTTTAAIRALSVDDTTKHPAASVRGIVNFTAEWNSDIEQGLTNTTVQDETGGIFVMLPVPAPVHLRLGDLVELRGEVQPGGFAPVLRAAEVKRLGRGELPAASPADYPGLRGGRFDSRLVEVNGVVRDVQFEPGVFPPSTVITLALDGGRAEVFMALLPEADFAGLIDARIRVRGVVFHYFNARRQTFDFRIMACEASQLTAIEPPPAPPEALPVTPVRQLLQFDPRGPSPHRVRVQGVVSLHWPGAFLFLQDGADGLLVRSRGAEPLRPGDVVDVTAFATMGDYAAQLEDARFHRIASQAPPAPVRRPLDRLNVGEADAQLVETEGELEGLAERDGRGSLILRRGTLLVAAELPLPLSALPPLRSGSLLRVTGVCQVEVGSQRRFARFFKPESARLLLRSLDDIVVVRAAPWWTPRRLAIALAALGAVLGVAVVWASSLQRKNLRLEAAIAARKRAEEEVRRRIDERNLLAADLHDSLEQSLTGVALQLRAARDDLDPAVERDQPHLTLAERLLEHSRAEVHRTVRDLRQPGDEPLDLLAALRELARISSSGSKVRVECALPPHLPPLPNHIGYQLLRLAQEGTTNALKHARAQAITITLRLAPAAATLEIRDDGAGFDPASCPGPATGHFGLQGMKERAARLEGTLELDSQPGRGTRLVARIPIPA